MSTNAQIAYTIRAVREFVAGGWTQCGGFDDGNGNVCLMGAVLEVTHTMPGCADYQEILDLFNPMAQKMGYPNVYDFNDDRPTIKKQDVLDFCDKALAELGV